MTPRRILAVAEYQSPEWHPAFEEYCEADLRAPRGRRRRHPGPHRRAPRRLAPGRVRDDQAHGGRGPRRARPARRSRLTDDGHAARRAGRAPPPPGRAVPHRHPRAVVGRGPPGSRQVGARHLRPVEAAIVRVLDNPTTCPHGNPIPGTDYDAARRGAPRRTSPSAAGSPCPASPRSSSSRPACSSSSRTPTCCPGTHGTITAASPDGTTTVEIDGRHVGIGAFASERILVTT